MDKPSKNEETNQEENETLPSRWWMLYHFWAGICLKYYFEKSGLSKFISNVFDGESQTSFSAHVLTATVLIVGSFALGYYLSKTLLKVINEGSIKKEVKTVIISILPIIYLITSIFLINITTPLLTSTTTIQKTKPSLTKNTSIKEVITYSTVQDAGGVTDSKLNQAILKNFETWIVQTMLKKLRNNYVENGYNPKDFKPKIVANSAYIDIDKKRLAIIKINVNNFSRLVTIIGIKGNEVHRISCIRASNHDIPVWSGKCGKKIKKIFNISINP